MAAHIEQIASTVLGKAKVAKGAIEGLSGVFTTLMEEHGQVSALMMRLKSSHDLELRRELWPEIRAELLSHEKGELAVLYPHYRQHPEVAHLADLHDSDAGHLEKMIERIHVLSMDDPRWPSLFAELTEHVHHHVIEEEREYFREGNRTFGQFSKELDKQYKEKKHQVMEHLLSY